MPPTDNLRASLWMVLAMALFAVEDLLIKFVTRSVPAGEIIALFGVAGALLWGGLAVRSGVALAGRGLIDRHVLIRNGAEALGSIAYVTALATIPLATASAILQSAPLAVTVGAALFLGERVGWRRWAAIGLGLAGVLMILRPGPEPMSAGALLAVGSVVLLAARDLATRRVPAGIHTLQLMTWAYLAVVPAGLVLMWIDGTGPVLPGPADAARLAIASVLGAAGYFGVTHAMRLGEAAAVAPFRYVRMVFALALAMGVLGERPDAWVLGGTALIVGTGLYALARARRRGGAAAAVAASPVAGDGL